MDVESLERWTPHRRAWSRCGKRGGGATYSTGVTQPTLNFAHRYEFAPSIVWDALVDPELLNGWLGDSAHQPTLGEPYEVRRLPASASSSYRGLVVRLDEFQAFVIEDDRGTSLSYRLTTQPGGNRGSVTTLEVQVAVPLEAGTARRVVADWLTSLDQLTDLLHGHPVDWRYWDRDYSSTWALHLEGADANRARHHLR